MSDNASGNAVTWKWVAIIAYTLIIPSLIGAAWHDLKQQGYDLKQQATNTKTELKAELGEVRADIKALYDLASGGASVRTGIMKDVKNNKENFEKEITRIEKRVDKIEDKMP
jgi:hypothetical protein